jgi:hypothetical protein
MRAIVTVALLGACSTAGNEVESLPPTIEITSPQRGTFSEAMEITVTGRVTDDKPGVTATVQGNAVTVAPDGTFSTKVTVEAGIATIESTAVDSDGQRVRDVRAILAGDTSPSDGSVKAPLGARLAPNGLKTVATAVAKAAEAIDFTAAAKAMNPVYNNDGCLGAKIDITSVSLASIDATMTPKAGALDTSVNVKNVVVRLHADFKVACIGGSTNITATASMARVRDDLTVGIAGGKIKTAVPSPAVVLEGFNVDVGGVPSAIEGLLRDQARSAAETRLAAIIQQKVPALADAKLAELVAKPVTVDLFGSATKFAVTPTKAELGTTGLFVAVDTAVTVSGGEGGTYAANPMPITSSLLARADKLGVAIADDAVNQLFAGLWAAGKFDLDISGEQAGIVAALLDDDVASISLSMSLPPTVKTAGTALELSVGDLIITAKDAAGTPVQTFALSATTTMVAGPGSNNKLVLTTTTPTVKAQVLSQSAVVDNPIDASKLEGIITGVWGVVGNMADDALAKLPMPALVGVQITAPTIECKDGYVVLDVGAQ